MESKKSFTGRARRKQNRWGVKSADTFARAIITFGGLATILAISGVFLILFSVIWPLLKGAEVTAEKETAASWTSQAFAVGVDDYLLLLWGLMPDGQVKIYQYETGEHVTDTTAFEDAELTAFSRSMNGKSVVLGFADGTVRVGQIGPETEFLKEDEVTEELRNLKPGEQVIHEGGILERTVQGDLRLQQIQADFSDPIEVADSAIRHLDYVMESGSNKSYHFLTVSEQGQVQLCDAEERVNLLTQDVTMRLRKHELPLDKQAHPSSPPSFVALASSASSAYVAWSDGTLFRFDTRNRREIELLESVSLFEDSQTRLTSMQMLLGRTTLLMGDSTGTTAGWFVPIVDPPQLPKLTRVHILEGPDAQVTSLANSATSRMLGVGYGNGEVRVFYVSTTELLTDSQLPKSASVQHLSMAPKNDALLAVSDGQLWQAAYDPGYPEASLSALFQPIWYENYKGPDHTWQSGGGSEDLEPKFGLMPLVFGTIKATVYSMLFGAPLALLAAIYTSEFMHARWRAKIKPLIEMMASLPSVVLGYIAGLVLAPYLESVVPTMLASFFAVPLVLLLSAHLWQMLPQEFTVRFTNWRLPLFLLSIPAGLWLATGLGPMGEQILFGGSIKAWLNGGEGSAAGGWFIAFLPLSALGVAMFYGSFLNPWLRQVSVNWNRPFAASMSLVKFFVGVMLTLAVAYGCGALLSLNGVDARDSIVGKYDPRNSLVVGFVMGFAIIPIIYTIADDALTTVPQHLRSGSYGCGATRWQTAVRIVIPTAMSGLFSALMIGLGRAVGETMIVLMATGSTPVMDWNMFNGFRTLSANIAVELPEAAKDSTHYRILFLAAMVLFLLTFIVNTAAELVRNRFRRRAYQL